MALPVLKTSDRIRLVYTGDPSLRAEGVKPSSYEWRTATPADAAAGATVAIIRPVNATEHKQAHINAGGNGEAFWMELLKTALVAIDGDPRPIAEIVESMPAAPRSGLGSAIARASSETTDPFGQRSSG